MHAVAWFGVILLPLGLAHVVFKRTIWIAVILFDAGILLRAMGTMTARRTT